MKRKFIDLVDKSTKGDPLSVRLNPGEKETLGEIAEQLEIKPSNLVAFLVADLISLYKRGGIEAIKNMEIDV